MLLVRQKCREMFELHPWLLYTGGILLTFFLSWQKSPFEKGRFLLGCLVSMRPIRRFYWRLSHLQIIQLQGPRREMRTSNFSIGGLHGQAELGLRLVHKCDPQLQDLQLGDRQLRWMLKWILHRLHRCLFARSPLWPQAMECQWAVHEHACKLCLCRQYRSMH
jgi:hypothetical protein